MRRRLADCSGMDDCADALKRAKTRMEDELLVLGQMTKALERAAEWYPAAEDRVVRECENLNVVIPQRAWGTNDLQSIRKDLAEFALF